VGQHDLLVRGAARLVGGGPLVASWFLIRTEALVTYVEVTPGVWDWISTGTYFNVRDMGVGTTAVVGLNMTFKDSTYREYWVSFNEEHWGGKDLKLVSGFARVTHPDADTWVLEPLGEGELRQSASPTRPTSSLTGRQSRRYTWWQLRPRRLVDAVRITLTALR